MLGAVNTATGIQGEESCTKPHAERKSLSRSVMVHMLSIVFTKEGLALHPADKTGQNFKYHSKVQYNSIT